MDTPRFSVAMPVCQCPRCGWPVEDRTEPGEIINLPALIKVNTIRRLAEHVAAKRRDVRADEIMNPAIREFRAAHARHEVMWMARELRNADGSHRFSFPLIARPFGMDHSSVQHGVKQHKRRLRLQTMAEVAADNASSARIHGAS